MDLSIIIILGIVGAILLVGFLVLITKYKTVSPDQAMIITGSFLGKSSVIRDTIAEEGIESNMGISSGKEAKIINGGGGAFILPFFQKAEFISLLSHKIDISTPEVYTEAGVPIIADATAIIKVGGTIEDISNAAEQYLGKTVESLKQEAMEVLEGHLRSILGSMTVEEIYKNRDRFSQEVQGVAAKDLRKMGLRIVSFTIKDIRDKNGYLESLGKSAIAGVKRDAQIAEAEANKEAAVKRAQADEEAAKAQLLMETNVAEATKEKELKIASSKKESDKAKAEADLAYEEQAAISQQAVIMATMKSKQIQMEKDIEIADRESVRREKELEGTVKKDADAELYRRQQEAKAQQFEQETKAQADAESVRLEAVAQAAAKEANAKADEEAEKARGLAAASIVEAHGRATSAAEKAKTEIVKAQGEMEAAAERARIDNLEAAGKAEAAAIEAKGVAEAAVAKQKAEVEISLAMGLADAANQASDIKALELITAILPALAEKIAAPMASIDKITIVDNGGDGKGINKMSTTVTDVMHTLPIIVEDMTGINMGNLLANLTKGRLVGNKPFDPNMDLQSLMKAAGQLDADTLDTLVTMVKTSKAASATSEE